MKSNNSQPTIQNDLSAEESRALLDLLEQHNFAQTDVRRDVLSIAMRDENGALIGGASGTMAWGLLYIQTIVVQPQFRGLGYGSQLLEAAEQEAIARGCHLAHLHTMSFQAPTFYENHGYEVFEILEGVPADHKRYLLKKSLR